jgi:hypothetical protein
MNRRSSEVEFLGTLIATGTVVSRRLPWRLHVHGPPTSTFAATEVRCRANRGSPHYQEAAGQRPDCRRRWPGLLIVVRGSSVGSGPGAALSAEEQVENGTALSAWCRSAEPFSGRVGDAAGSGTSLRSSPGCGRSPAPVVSLAPGTTRRSGRCGSGSSLSGKRGAARDVIP